MSEDPRDRVLIVDDDAAVRRAVERVLAPLYETEAVEGTSQALARLEAGHFDVALVDVQLNDGDGYALCQRIRQSHPETDVILMTGSLSEPDEKLFRSLEEGAFYFLFKPFERRVLRALVARAVELQKARRTKEKYAAALAADLERARRFQRSLMPREALREAGWHVEGRFEPCDALGGDFYLFLSNGDGTLAVAISDVVGHGVSAAMLAGMLRSVLDTARRRSPDPGSVLRELAGGVDFFEGARYASLFYARLSREGRVGYFNAGHPPVFFRPRAGGVDVLDSTGLILTSALPRRREEVAQLEMRRGDRLLLFTDGLYEARDPMDRELGRDALGSFLEESAALPAADVLDRLMERVRTHAAGRPLTDDATVMLIERL